MRTTIIHIMGYIVKKKNLKRQILIINHAVNSMKINSFAVRSVFI